MRPHSQTSQDEAETTQQQQPHWMLAHLAQHHPIDMPLTTPPAHSRSLQSEVEEATTDPLSPVEDESESSVADLWLQAGAASPTPSPPPAAASISDSQRLPPMSRMHVRPANQPASPFSPFPSPTESPRSHAMAPARRSPIAAPPEDELSLSVVAGGAVEPASPNASTDDSSLLQRALQPSSRSSIIYLDSAVAAPARSSAYRRDPNHCSCWRVVTWSWHHCHSRIWLPLANVPAWTRRWRRGQQLFRELSNHSGSGPPASANGCMRRCAFRTYPLLRRHWMLCSLLVLLVLVLWLSFVSVLLSSHDVTTSGAGEHDGDFFSPLGRVSTKFLRREPAGDAEGEAAILLDPSRLSSQRHWNLHNSDSNKLASGVKSQAVAAAASAGSTKAPAEHRHLHLHELSEKLQAQADSRGSEPRRLPPLAAVSPSPPASAAPPSLSGDLSDAMIDALQKSWEGLTPEMQAERKQRASKQSKQAKQAAQEAERIRGRIRTRLEHEKYVKPDPILPLLARNTSASAGSTESNVWQECACIQRNLPKFALLQDKLLVPAFSADPQRLPLIETLLDSIEACVPMEPECAARWSEGQYAAMDDLLRQQQQQPPLFDRSQPPPPHPPIAILLSPSHFGLTLSSAAAVLDDASLRLSPRWTELKLLLLRLWSMPGVEPSRIFLFMPRLEGGQDGSTSLDVPAWFRSDWRTLHSQSSGDASADSSPAGAAHARIVSAFQQLQIVDIEAAAGVDGQAWAHERVEWEVRRSRALAEFDRKQQLAQDAAAAAAEVDDANSPPPLSSLSPSVARAELDLAFSRELHRMRSNLDHWSLLTYMFDPEDLPDAMVVDLMARQAAKDGSNQLQSFDSLILMDPQSFPALDLLNYFTRTSLLLNPPRLAPQSTHTDHSIVLVSANNAAPTIEVTSSESQRQFTSISASGMQRSTGWLPPLSAAAGGGGGAWMLPRSLFESVRTCPTCWPVSDLSLGGGGGAHAKSTAPRSSKRTQRSNERHMARMRLIRAAQEREGKPDDALESPASAARSSLAAHPSSALLSSSVAAFNEDSCRLSRWDEPFAKFVAHHNEAQRALEEASLKPSGSNSNSKGPWRGLKSLESLQPLVSRVQRINLRGTAADLKHSVQEQIQRANFLPDRWSPSRSDVSTLLSRSYQLQVYSRLYSVHEHDIVASVVDPGWSALTVRYFSPEEIAAEELRVRQESWTRSQAVDEEVLPCLLSLWLSPSARAGRDVIVLLDDLADAVDDAPSQSSGNLWTLISEGLMDFSGSTPAVHHGLLTWIRPSSSALEHSPSNIFFLAASSLYHTQYGIARSTGRRGINRATLLASLRALGSAAASPAGSGAVAAGKSYEPRQAEDGARIMMSALFPHALPAPTPTAEARFESSVLFPDALPIDRTWHHDHNCLSLLRDLPEHVGAAAGDDVAWIVHPRIVYRPSLNSLSDASSDSKLHLRSRWNLRIPRLRHGRGCESSLNTTEEQEDHGWTAQQQPTVEIDRSEFVPEEDDPAAAAAAKAPVLLRAAAPPSPLPRQQGPVSATHFAPGVCMVVGHAGESCTEVCAGLVSTAADNSAASADGAVVPPPTPSSEHSGLFRCAPAAFELLHTYPLVFSRYFRDFGLCATHGEVSMHARWDTGAVQEWHPSISMPGVANHNRAHCDLLAPALQHVSTCEAKPPPSGGLLIRRVCPCEVAPTQHSP